MYPILNIALKVARSTGLVLTREFDRIDAYRNEAQNIAQVVRQEAETKVIQSLKGAYPQHGLILSSYQAQTDAEMVWLVDVLNGENNYKRGIPHFAICISILQKGKGEHILIYDPICDEVFSASRGGNAQFNNSRMRIDSNHDLAHSLVAGNQATKLANTETKAAFRDTGCNALMLAYVATGRFDAFMGDQLTLNELTAGTVMIKSAGGLYSDLQGANDYTTRSELLAANPKLFKVLLQQLR